ncbi:MAG: double-stranded RNA binding motif domain-containing protein, partial [Cyanobacteria bacterium J06555_13]
VEIDEPAVSLAASDEAQESDPTPASVSTPPPILQKELKDGQNFIGFLQQLCQTLRCDFPKYEFDGETPEFVCTCSVWIEGQRFRGRAISSQKKKAKYFASKVVLLNLQQYFQSRSEA